MGLLDGLLGQVLSGALKPGQDDGRGLPDMGRTGGQGMGGLESILGGLAGGQPGAGQGKGGLESILGGLAGGAGTGAGPATGAQGGGGALIAILLQMLQQHGGLGGLLSQFQQAGYGKQADSWVSTGESAPPAAAAAGYDTWRGVVRPRKRVMLALGISAAMAPAMKKAGNRHNSTWAAR